MANKKKVTEKRDLGTKKHFGAKFSMALSMILVFYFVLLGLQIFRENRMPKETSLNKYSVVLKSYPETESWKEYRNKNWSFKYPNDWVVVNCGAENWLMLGPKIVDSQKVNCKADYPHPNPEVYISRQKLSEAVLTDYGKLGKYDEIFIGGKKARVETDLNLRGDFSQQTVYIENGEFLDTVNFWNISRHYRETFYKVLSTFKSL